MKVDAIFAHELEGIIETISPGTVFIRIRQPGLIDLVFGEAVFGQKPRAEVAVNHAHRGVAEHQGQDAPLAHVVGDALAQRRASGDTAAEKRSSFSA